MKATSHRSLAVGLAATFTVCLGAGCNPPQITAVNLDPNSGETQSGIPYYLPKPYLVITRNIRFIPTPTVGLTQTVPIPSSFNTGGSSNPSAGGGGGSGNGAGTGGTGKGQTTGQAGTGGDNSTQTTGTETAAADLTSNSTSTTAPGSTPTPSPGKPNQGSTASPGSVYGNQVLGPASIAVVPPAPISDGLIPQEFYTYQILYLPDLTQKYGLQIKGGAGELRATENLVNGWMHTGPGPLYIADSTTAQNVIATGQAASDVTQALGQIALSAAGIPTVPPGVGTGTGTGKTATETAALNPPKPIKDYAQIYIFEPELVTDAAGKKKEVWRMMNGLPKFQRDWIELERDAATPPGTGGGGAPASPAAAGDAAAAAAIRTALQGAWTIGPQALTVDTSGGMIHVTIAAKSIAPGGTATQLTTDAFNAAKAYDISAGLSVPQDPAHILVTAAIDPTP